MENKRIVVVILDGLINAVFLPVELDEIPVQVLNLDKEDPSDSSRYQAFKQAIGDRYIVGVDYTFIGTEDDKTGA